MGLGLLMKESCVHRTSRITEIRILGLIGMFFLTGLLIPVQMVWAEEENGDDSEIVSQEEKF